MKKLYIGYLTLICCLFTQAQDFECISLGSICSSAAALQGFKLRKSAYPFDWMISSYPSLYGTLQQDFADFLTGDLLTIRHDNHGIINKYGLIFVHDFPTINYTGNAIGQEDEITESILHPLWKDSLPQIQEKYARRINRFREKCSGSNKIYFIRHRGNESRQEACQLRDLFKSMYPNLDFTLVIVGSDHSYSNPWHEPNIKNYYLNDSSVWNDAKQWKIIFEDLGIIDKQRSMPLDGIVERYKDALCGHCDYCNKIITNFD